ncbi:MAG: tape measure protein [Pyrinomonadaceae bacterium]
MSTVARINAEINLKDNLTRPLNEAGAQVKKFADKAKGDLTRFSAESRAAWKAFGDGLGKASRKAQMAGAALTLGLTVPIAGFAKVAVDAAAKMESMTASMTAVTGSAGAAQAQLLELEKMAGRTASSYDLLVTASKGLIAGFDGDVKASNAVLERFATLSNVMGVSRTDFERLVINLTQIGGASRLTGDELREMASILPNLRSLLKQAFGTSQSEDLAKLGITGRQALEGIMKAIDSRGFKANTDTYNAQLQILSTEFFKLKVVAGEVFLPIARTVVQYLTPAFEKLAEHIRKLTPEQKKMATVFLAVVAAAGPALAILGSLGNAVAGLIAGWGTLAKIGGLLSTALSASGGAAGILRVALAALTGPVGIAIAAVTALYLAWKNNFAGIRDVVMPFVEQIKGMVSDLYENIKSTFDQIWPVIVSTWKTVVVKSKPIIDFFVNYLQWHWNNMMTAVTVAFRFITDVINVSLAGWKMLFGAGWSDLTNSMKASLLRMRGIAITILSNIAQFVVSAFRAMTGWMSMIPGVGDFYDKIVEGAQGRIDALRSEGAAAGWLADKYQDLADKERKIVVPKVPRPSNATIKGDGFRSLVPNPGAGGGGGKLSIEPEKETEEERLKKGILADILKLQAELNAEKLKAAGATLRDVLAMEEYGKKYDDLSTSYRKAKIDAMAALETFKKEQEERVKAAEEEAERLKAALKARVDLNRAVLDSGAAFAKEREQLYFTTEEERARWEVTKGGYREADGWAKILYLAQAKLLDQARKAKEAGEKWKEFWTGLIAKHKEWLAEQTGTANERYEEYIKRLTEDMLKLAGAQEQVLRNDLTEQFKGFAAGAKTAEEGAARVKEKVDDIIARVKILTDAKAKIAQIQEIADQIEDIFKKSLDNLFENGFKGFFASVVEGFRDLARKMAAEFLKIQLMKALLWGAGQIFGGGKGGAGSIVGGFLGIDNKTTAKKGMAPGFGGSPYMRSSGGPAAFIPSGEGGTLIGGDGRKGMASPAAAGAGGGGGGTSIVVNLQVPNYAAFKRSEAQSAALVFARAGRAKQREGR